MNWTEDDYMSPEQEREQEAREKCARLGLDPDDYAADGAFVWMVVDQEMRQRETARCTTAAPFSIFGDDVAWLVEWPISDNMPARWWHCETGWMTDPSKATRFAREQDAASYIATSRMLGGVGIKATEHVWVAPPVVHPLDECMRRTQEIMAGWASTRDCFWPRCSNHKRCDEYGSCVAQAQAGGKSFPPESISASPPSPHLDTMNWRYEIKYGPEGEADYAWVYDDKGQMVCTTKTHFAIAIVSAVKGAALTPQEQK